MAKQQPKQKSTTPGTETKAVTSYPTLSDSQQKNWKYAFLIIAVALFFVRPILSYHFGPSSDEVYHKVIGDFSYDYLSTAGKNDTIFHYSPNGRDDGALLLNYGPLLEVTASALYKNFNLDPLPTRHLVITLFTFLLFLFAGLTGKQIGGWRAGTIAMLFMVLAPRILGEAFNNPKDPPFAAGYMMSIFALIYYFEKLPKPTWKATLLLMLGIGLAFAIRVGGLLLYAYLGLFLLIALLSNEEWKKKLLAFDFTYYRPLIISLLVVFFGSWIIGIITWPAALKAPFTHPFYALQVQSTYPTVIRVLFGGEYIPSNEVPWNYNLTYIAYTTPVITLIGLVASIVLFPAMRKMYKTQYLVLLLFVSLFPLFYIIYKKSALLNGWRHSYFTFTGLCVMAALGFETLFRLIKPKVGQYVLYAVLGLGMLSPALFIVNNFPMIYVYFNELAGGVDGTYGDYQMDYYACSAKPAADWMTKNVPMNAGEKIVSNNPWELNMCWESGKSPRKSEYIRFRERNEQNWDYAVFLPQFVDPKMMKRHFFPPKGTIHEIKVDNSVIACVVKRENKSDFYGIEAVKKNDFVNGIKLLEDAVKYDGYNEIAWTYLGIAYANTGRMQEASTALTNAINISPEYQLPQYYYQQIAGQGR